MSVRFNADADRLQRTTNLPAWDSYTFACFVHLVNDVDNYSAIFSLEENGSSYHVLETDADGVSLHCYMGFSVDLNLGNAFGPLSVGTWYFVAFSHDAVQGHGYIGAVGPGTAALAVTNSSPDATARTFVNMFIGGDGFAEPGDLRLAGVRIWDAVLSLEELENERRAIQPFRRSDLNSFYPLLMAGEKLVDSSGNGRDLTTPGAGTWETEENPPVPWRQPRARLIQPSAAVNYVLTADPGEVAIAGTDAFLLQQARLTAAPGAVVLSGPVANLTAAHVLGAAGGAVDITGQDAQLQAQHLLTASPGAVAIVGQDVELLARLLLAANAGAVTVAGSGAVLTAGHRLTADPGGVTIVGTDASLSVEVGRKPSATLELVSTPQAQLLVQPSPAAILEIL